MLERRVPSAPQPSSLAAALQVTSDWLPSLLEPLLLELREERCAHSWQPALAAEPAHAAVGVLERLVASGRPSTVFTYFESAGGRDEAVAVATMSPRVARGSPEDGIPVLGRAYVRPRFRSRSVYTQVLRHRLSLCVQRWGTRLLGVHMGTSMPRVEAVFRASFSGRVITLGQEDLGRAGTVVALMGLTAEFDRQLALPVPAPLAQAHQHVRAYLARGADAMPVAEAWPALRALVGCQDAYRILDQFLDGMPNLR